MPNEEYWSFYRASFAFKDPLPEVWQGLTHRGRVQALQFWLAWAARDPWTFVQLGHLAAAIIAAGETLPKPLMTFTVSILNGETKAPKRAGPKGNPQRDVWIAGLLESLTDLGCSRREACRTVGTTLNLAPETIESAWRRVASV